jgi:hypothetical protein
MNNIGIPDRIDVYVSAFIILLLFIATVVFRITRKKKGERKLQRTVSESTVVEPEKHETHPMNNSGVPERMLPSSDIYTMESKQNSVMENIELLDPLKKGILWAEILGRPGGRRQGNT